MTKKRFPWDCGGCPMLHTYDLSVDDLTYRCLWSKCQIDDCDRYKSADCPMEEHDKEIRAKAIDDYTEWLRKTHANFDEDYAEDIESDYLEQLKEQKNAK